MASDRKRLGLLMLLLAAAAAFGAYRLVQWRQEESGEPPESFRSDEERLARLRKQPFRLPPVSPRRGDWPQWRGPDRSGLSPEHPGSLPWPAGGPRRIWSVAGGPGHSGPAVASGRVFTLVQAGDEESALALDAATGTTLWSCRWKARFEEKTAGLGPHTTPAVVDDRVYTLGSTGVLHCLDASTGRILWRQDLLKEFSLPQPQYGVSGNPLVEGDLVIVQPGAGKGGALAAYDRRDGRRIWSAGDDPGGYSSPVAATIAGQRQIVFVTGESVMGADVRDGRVLWRFPWKTQGDYNVATPLVAQDYVFVSSGYGKGCALLELTRDAQGVFAARPVYEHNRMRNVFSTSVLAGEHLYGFDEQFLACMDFRTGKILWKQRGAGRGSMIAADRTLVVLGEEGTLAMVEASPAGYHEISSAKISATRCWALPALSEGRLVVRDQETIQCFDLGTSR